MTLLYYDPIFLEHETGNHPENAQRLRSVIARLDENGVTARCDRRACVAAKIDQLQYVHSADDVEQIKRFIDEGGGRIEQDTYTSAKSFEVAQTAAGTAIDATRRVVDGEDKTAFCLLRPPGHHATHSRPMGFCLFNNIAVAARVAIEELELERVMIVDWDVHHGNGTQDAFWDDPQVGFLSMHRYPFYPGSGAADETGVAAGKDLTVNLPIEYGTAADVQLKKFQAAAERLADKIKPQLILVSAGFDSHALDPVGSLGLQSEHFVTLTKSMLDIATTQCDGRLVSLLEGGYNPDALAESVECHLTTLLEA